MNGCGATNSLVLSDFQLPLEYDEVAEQHLWPSKCVPKKIVFPISSLQIAFDFTNIGSVLGAAVSLIGSFAIDFGRGLIVNGVKQVFLFNLDFFSFRFWSHCGECQEGFPWICASPSELWGQSLVAGYHRAASEPAVRRWPLPQHHPHATPPPNPHFLRVSFSLQRSAIADTLLLAVALGMIYWRRPMEAGALTLSSTFLVPNNEEDGDTNDDDIHFDGDDELAQEGSSLWDACHESVEWWPGQVSFSSPLMTACSQSHFQCWWSFAWFLLSF